MSTVEGTLGSPLPRAHPSAGEPPARAPSERRVRHLVRESVALVVFSAVASVAVALLMAGALLAALSLGR